METLGKKRFEVGASFELGDQGEGRAHVSFLEEDGLSLVVHLQQWETDEDRVEWRNYGLTLEAPLETGDVKRHALSPEDLQRLVDRYPYWLNLACAIAERPVEADKKTRGTLRRDSWKPAQPGRSPAFLEEVAEEFVRRFDAGENAVTEMARAHGVAPGTISKWLTKANDDRVRERRASRYRRRP